MKKLDEEQKGYVRGLLSEVYNKAFMFNDVEDIIKREELDPKPIYEKNNWYWIDDCVLAYFTHVGDGFAIGYGIDKNGDWIYNSGGQWMLNSLTVREATDEEVEEALIKEAKNRGFLVGEGVRFLTPLGKYERVFSAFGNYGFHLTENGGKKTLNAYVRDNGGIMCSIFSSGKWAEIIEEDVVLTIKEIEEKLNITNLKIKK